MTFALAQRLLRAVAAGEASEGLAEELARAVLETEVVKLALEVAAGGEHRWRRAIELAGLLCRAAASEAVPGAVSGERTQRA